MTGGTPRPPDWSACDEADRARESRRKHAEARRLQDPIFQVRLLLSRQILIAAIRCGPDSSTASWSELPAASVEAADRLLAALAPPPDPDPFEGAR